MSYLLSRQVWELKLSHHEQAVLLLLAYHADHKTRCVRADKLWICDKTGLSAKSAMAATKSLLHAGILEAIPATYQDIYRPTLRRIQKYRLDLDQAERKPPYLGNISFQIGNPENLFTPREVWERRRKLITPEVFARDGFACQYCGREENLTVDHVVPLSRGGTNDMGNLRTCCGSCNSSKGTKTLEEWQS